MQIARHFSNSKDKNASVASPMSATFYPRYTIDMICVYDACERYTYVYMKWLCRFCRPSKKSWLPMSINIRLMHFSLASDDRLSTDCRLIWPIGKTSIIWRCSDIDYGAEMLCWASYSRTCHGWDGRFTPTWTHLLFVHFRFFSSVRFRWWFRLECGRFSEKFASPYFSHFYLPLPPSTLPCPCTRSLARFIN